jgi:thiamine pyrophosphokinase
MNEPCVLIVGGSPERPSPELLRRLSERCSYCLACDSGADACLAAGVHIDELVGDDDSLSPEALRYAIDGGARRKLFPMDKDKVDLALALDILQERGVSNAIVSGVSGGRPDHALAAVGAVARAPRIACVIEENDFSCIVLHASGESQGVARACESSSASACPHIWRANADDLGKTVSVIAPLGASVVSESGMRWDVDRGRIEALDDLGVSNVIERIPAWVEVHEGTALVYVLRNRIVKHALDGVEAR